MNHKQKYHSKCCCR